MMTQSLLELGKQSKLSVLQQFILATCCREPCMLRVSPSVHCCRQPAWCCRCGEGPLLVRVSQLSIDTLRRSLALASQCVNNALAARVPSSTSAPQAAHQTLITQSTPLQQQQQQQYGIVIRNRCAVDLLCRQVGTAECVRLPADTGLPYCWHTPPGMTPPGMDLPGPAARLLCIASVPPSNAEPTPTPPPESPLPELGTASSPPPSALPLQSSPLSPTVLEPKDARVAVMRPSKQTHHELATSLIPTSLDFGGTLGSSKTAGLGSGLGLGLAPQLLQSAEAVLAMPWSHSFDCMSSHSCQVRLRLPNGGTCTLAVSVHKVGLHWQVLLQPSFVLLNKAAAAVHLHYTGELLTSKGRRAGVSVGAEGQREGSELASEVGYSFVLEPESKVGDGKPRLVCMQIQVGCTCLFSWSLRAQAFRLAH